jgi:hypothetical protein
VLKYWQVLYRYEELRVKQVLDAVGTIGDLRALLLTSHLELTIACGDDAVIALLIDAKYVQQLLCF